MPCRPAKLPARLVARISKNYRRHALLITGSLVIMGIGLVAMGFLLNPEAGFWTYLLPLVLFGGGFSICNTPRISVVLSAAPPELAGSASATNNAVLQLGTAVGIATLGRCSKALRATPTFLNSKKLV
jgi:DHA2 family methylenomycin A resistance protein-like MFS transporter